MQARSHGWRHRTVAAATVALVLVLAGGAVTAAAGSQPQVDVRVQPPPRYDVPRGYSRCPRVTALNGFFKWTSVRGTTCRAAASFLRAYARATAAGAGPMPRRVARRTCRISYWRNAEGDIYASRHSCARGKQVVRFYGMV